jgi:hypothetical protein
MEIRKILDILEASVRFKKPTKVLDEEPVAAFGQTYTPPPSEPDTRGAAAMASKSAPTASSAPPSDGTPFTNPTPNVAASPAPAAATQTPPPNTNALGIAAQANVPGSPTAVNVPKAAAAPANNQAAAPAKTYGGGYDPNKVQYAYSGGKPAPAAPTASAQQSAASDASKKNVIGGGVQNAIAGAASPAAKPTASAPPSASLDAAKKNAIGGTQAAPDTRGAAAMASKSAPTQTSDQIATAALNKPAATPANDTRGAAAMASRSAPAPQNRGTMTQLPEPSKPGSFSATGMAAADFEESIEEEIEEELAEAFNDMLRLSGIQLNEKAVSKQQQKFMGMVHAMQKGERVKGASAELKAAAKGMGKKDAKDFASTKHKGLPKKVTEGVMLEAGSTLEHIVNKFKHETKKFINGEDLDSDLYEALFDYYNDNGEIPYGVAKARDGDPYTWIENRFEDELSMMGYPRTHDELNYRGDQDLTELARLAGLTNEGMLDDVKTTIDKAMLPKAMHADYDRYQAQKARKEYYKKPYVDDAGTIYGPEGNPESMPSIRAKDLFDPEPNRDRDMFAMASGAKPASAADKVNLPTMPRLKEDELTECGDMEMEQDDRYNVSTNMSSDGTRSVNISAQGSKADELLQMLKMAGMRPHDDHDHEAMSEPAVVMISSDEEMMDEELEEARKKRTTRYVNTPDEEYQTVASITRQGNDLNREKKQFAGKPRLGDNPMAESALDADLDAMLESILVREEEKPTWLQRQPSKSQEEIAQDWKARGEASKDYVIPAERPYKDEKTGRMITPPRGATNPPPDSEFPPGDPRNSRPLKSKGK